MTEGRINWLGADGKYRTEDTGDVGAPGDFVVAEDRDGNTILLEWDATAEEWQYGGPVDMAGADISTVGTLGTDAVENSDYNEAVETHTTASGTVSIDLSVANVHRVEAIDNITIEFENATADPAGNSVVIYVVDDDGDGPYTISWPESVEWDDGNVVDEVGADSNVEIGLLSDDGGDTWRGRESGVAFA